MSQSNTSSAMTHQPAIINSECTEIWDLDELITREDRMARAKPYLEMTTKKFVEAMATLPTTEKTDFVSNLLEEVSKDLEAYSKNLLARKPSIRWPIPAMLSHLRELSESEEKDQDQLDEFLKGTISWDELDATVMKGTPESFLKKVKSSFEADLLAAWINGAVVESQKSSEGQSWNDDSVVFVPAMDSDEFRDWARKQMMVAYQSQRDIHLAEEEDNI